MFMYVTNTLNVFFEVSRSLFYITKFSTSSHKYKEVKNILQENLWL